jgi:3-oxoacyl-[acyl-carrier protein] reductase
MDETQLAEKCVLVTGGSGEIGKAIVKRLSQEGASVIIQFNRDRASAEKLQREIGTKSWLIQADLRVPTERARLWEQAVSAAGRIYGLVNNAGIRTSIPVHSDWASWHKAWQDDFEINFFAAADLCKAAILHFRAERSGRIINMASRAAQRGYHADAMPYGASKAALINLTKSIAGSFGSEGIIATAIAPGWVRTEMARQYVETHGEESATGDIPIGEMAAATEVAELVAFVMRPSQKSLNGATLDVNGGSYIR